MVMPQEFECWWETTNEQSGQVTRSNVEQCFPENICSLRNEERFEGQVFKYEINKRDENYLRNWYV